MDTSAFKDGLKAAWPIMAGYIVLGLPCGLLCQQAGMSWQMVLIMCVVFYSGAGQYMIPNMWLAGNPLLTIILSVSLVNTRQMLYGAALSRYCEGVSRRLTFLFGATVTDESFGMNLAHFELGGWDVKRATIVNLCSQSSWTVACVAGALVGNLVSVPTAIASFAMTSIFICLLCMQKMNATNIVTIVAAAIGVGVCKVIGLTGPAILLGALVGIAAGYAFGCLRERDGRAEAGHGGECDLDGGRGNGGECKEEGEKGAVTGHASESLQMYESEVGEGCREESGPVEKTGHGGEAEGGDDR